MSKADQDRADDARDVDGGHVRDGTEGGTADDERPRASRPSQLWLVAAGLCLFAAAALWLLDQADAAFVVAALGVVSWFLNVRVQLRHKNSRGDAETRGEEETEET